MEHALPQQFIHTFKDGSLKLLLSPTLEGNWIKFLSPDADFYFPILFIYFLDGWGVASIHVFFSLDSICRRYMIATHDTLSVLALFYCLGIFRLFGIFCMIFICRVCLSMPVLLWGSCNCIFVATRMNFCIILRCRSMVLISTHTSFPCLSCVDKLNLSPSWKFSHRDQEVVIPSVYKHVDCIK